MENKKWEMKNAKCGFKTTDERCRSSGGLSDDAQDRQAQVLLAACCFCTRCLRQEGFRKLDDLFGAFKEHVVLAVAVVFAFVGGVGATDLRTVVVDAATIVLLQVFAVVVDHQKPLVTVHEDRDAAMDQIPAQIVEVLGRFRRFDRQGEVAATPGGAVLAEIFTRFEIGPRDFGLGHGSIWYEKKVRVKGGGVYR